MTAELGETVMARRRRVVVRPRLIRALDGASPRVRMLVAAAGYGKTTLAEQWIAVGDRPAAWYAARNASADVAVLSAGLAQTAASIVPGCDSRLRERLMSTQSPADDAAVLAEMLAEDLVDWPSGAWLVVDDYERLCRAPEAEEFMEVLVASSPLNLLVASRQRPAWVSSRDILYGDVFELGQTALAMTLDEAEAVLTEWPSDQASGLTRLADGWPAVVGLAGLIPAPDDLDADVPDALYEFFAEEVYAGLSVETQRGLALLAVAPVLDRELALSILGEGWCESTCREALQRGVLDERRGRLDLHPLARGFLELKVSLGASESGKAIRRALAIYRGRRDWDAAFDLVERGRLSSERELVIEQALDDLFNAARVATVETWLKHSDELRDSPVLQVARAELRLRQGRHTAAQMLAESVLDVEISTSLAYRATCVSGRAAHMGCRDAEGLGFYRRAEEYASNERERRNAQLGQVMCAAALERDEAREILADLSVTGPGCDPVDLIRTADRQLSVGFRFGSIDALDHAREVAELVGDVRDPVVRCSFQSTFSGALAINSDYTRAAVVAGRLIEDASRYRINMAMPYGLTLKAMALSGLHRFAEAFALLDEAEVLVRDFNDQFGIATVYAIRVRVLLQVGRVAEACAIEPPRLRLGVPGIEGELSASRGLALACIGRTAEASALADEALRRTRAIEARVLARAVRAIVAVKLRSKSMRQHLRDLLDHTFESGGIDMFVTSYRASNDLLGVLLSDQATSERTMHAMIRAGDEALADDVGHPLLGVVDPLQRLTKREYEVYRLLCDGLSNRDIAGQLFITESTVKVHVHHVFDKLGIRSRTALALSAARSRQAAPSAADVIDANSGSSTG